MSNIINFPKRPAVGIHRPPEPPGQSPPKTKLNKIFAGVVNGLWAALVLLWPIAKVILAVDVLWQFARMCWYWSADDVHAGWTFSLHFLLLVAGYWLVASYRTKEPG